MPHNHLMPWKSDSQGILLTVRLTPRGGRDSIDGIGALSDGRAVVLARVRAVPEDGAANAALEKLLAKTLKIPASHVTIASGHTSRIKTVRIADVNEDLILLLEKFGH